MTKLHPDCKCATVRMYGKGASKSYTVGGMRFELDISHRVADLSVIKVLLRKANFSVIQYNAQNEKVGASDSGPAAKKVVPRSVTLHVKRPDPETEVAPPKEPEALSVEATSSEPKVSELPASAHPAWDKQDNKTALTAALTSRRPELDQTELTKREMIAELIEFDGPR